MINEDNDFITLVVACKITGVSEGTVRNQIWEDKPTAFPVYKHPIGGRLVVRRSDAEDYKRRLLAECRVGGGRNAGDTK